MIRFLLVESDGMNTILPKMIDSCLSCSKEAETNLADVSIANNICYYLYCVVFVCVAGVLLWKALEIIAKGISGLATHCWDKEERLFKKKSELLDKYLDFVKKDTTIKDYATITEYDIQQKKYLNRLLELLEYKIQEKTLDYENIIKEFRDELNPVIQQETNIDQEKYNQYKKTLESMLGLPQQDEPKIFSFKDYLKKCKINKIFSSHKGNSQTISPAS